MSPNTNWDRRKGGHDSTGADWQRHRAEQGAKTGRPAARIEAPESGIYVQDPDFTLYVGDALDVLRELPSESVHMCVTSPPFFGLRDYSVEGQIGLEASPDEWVARLVDVFREVRRVLRHDATLWLEVGDSYATGTTAKRNPTSSAAHGNWERDAAFARVDVPGLPAKNLIGAPWRLAFALQADGWILRSDIIFSRPNPMPESVRDRPTKSHSYVFLLSKGPRYFFDQEAVREEAQYGFSGTVLRDVDTRGYDHDRKTSRTVTPGNGAGGRNIRSVWTIATEPLPDEHYAAYPQKLVERCILAGTSERGCCPECGAPWERVVEREGSTWADRKAMGHPGRYGYSQAGTSSADAPLGRIITETMGWQPTCGHAHKLPDPAVVLDPFLGSGTTALVARRLGRHTIGIELSPAYAAMAARRLQQLSLLA